MALELKAPSPNKNGLEGGSSLGLGRHGWRCCQQQVGCWEAGGLNDLHTCNEYMYMYMCKLIQGYEC